MMLGTALTLKALDHRTIEAPVTAATDPLERFSL
jgi:hypothetical protein